MNPKDYPEVPDLFPKFDSEVSAELIALQAQWLQEKKLAIELQAQAKVQAKRVQDLEDRMLYLAGVPLSKITSR